VEKRGEGVKMGVWKKSESQGRGGLREVVAGKTRSRENKRVSVRKRDEMGGGGGRTGRGGEGQKRGMREVEGKRGMKE